MKTSHIITYGVVTAVLFSAARLSAEAWSYEGCDYAPTNSIAGLLGGKGWDGPWYQQTAGQDAFTVVGTGLTYNDGVENLAVKGGAFRCNNLRISGGEMKRKPMVTPAMQYLLTNGQFFGLQGTTNWFSFLARVDGPLQRIIGTTTNWLGTQGIELNKAANSTMDNFERVMMGARCSVGGYDRLLSNRWIIGGFGGAVPDNGLYTGTVEIVSGQTVFYVARLIYGAPTRSNILATMWINPALSNEPSESSGVTPPVWNMMWQFLSNPAEIREWNAFTLDGAVGAFFATNNLSYGYIDELRFGQTYRDVAPRDYEISPVSQPVNQAPANGAMDVTLPVTIEGSPFSSHLGDIHAGTRIQLLSANGVSVMIETGALTVVTLPAGLLRESTRYSWTIQYKGTNSPLWSDPSEPTTFTVGAPTGPMLIAYDGCDYAVTLFPDDVSKYSGGYGFIDPWQGVWVSSGLTRVGSETPGLFYKFEGSGDYLLAVRNRFRTTQIGKESIAGAEERITAVSRTTRRVSTDGGLHLITSSNTYGKVGTTNWFSFLARYESGDNAGRYGLDFNVGYQGNYPYEFFIGKPAANDNWGFVGKGGSPVVVSDVSAVDGQTALLLTRVIYGTTMATVHLWVNPGFREQPDENDAFATNTVRNFEFNYIGIVAQASGEAPNAGIDEIRFGDAWEAVMPLGPPPPLSVGTPTNTAPADGTVGVALPPTVGASEFNGAGPNDLHVGTEFKFISLNGVETVISTGGLTSITVPAGVLKSSTKYSWQTRYLGTNTTAWSEWSEATEFTTVAGAPRLIAYDGANYGVTNTISGRKGGSGWSGGWEGMFWNFNAQDYLQSRVGVAEPGMEYTDAGLNSLVAITNRFVASNEGSHTTTVAFVPATRARRTIAKDGNMHLLDNNNMFGKTDTTNWFSFLCRFESGSADAYFGLELTGDGTEEKQSSRFVIGKPKDTTTWGLQMQGGYAASGIDALSSSGAFLVARVIFRAGNESADLWVDPEFGPEPPMTPSAHLDNVTNFVWSRVGIVSHQGSIECPIVSVDEIRVGEDWTSVTPFIPEPMSVGMAAIVALALMRRR